MIVSFFGPDGVGKSTLARALQAKGWYIFSGTGVASWPDKTWHNTLVSQGIDETSLNNETHFLEKIQRAHQLARNLEEQYKKVIIDSDPLHKTLMHDYQKALPDTQKAGQRLLDRLKTLQEIAGSSTKQHTHVYFQIAEHDDTHEQAKILQQRLMSRGKLAHFDPRSVEQSQKSIETYRELKNLLISQGKKVVVVNTSQPLDIKEVLSRIAEAS